jgi:hypothetical protein
MIYGVGTHDVSFLIAPMYIYNIVYEYNYCLN